MSSDEAYTLTEMAQMLGITVRTLRNRCYSGVNHPPYDNLTTERPFPREAYNRWRESNLKREIKRTS